MTRSNILLGVKGSFIKHLRGEETFLTKYFECVNLFLRLNFIRKIRLIKSSGRFYIIKGELETIHTDDTQLSSAEKRHIDGMRADIPVGT